MRRVSIGKLMGVVAFVAANLALGRYLIDRHLLDRRSGDDPLPILAFGFLPLVEAHLIGLFLLLRKYRVAIRLRNRSDQLRFAPAFVAWSGAMILAALGAFLVDWTVLYFYFEGLGVRVNPYLQAWGIGPLGEEDDLHKIVIVPAFFGLILSGPPLLLAAILSGLANWFRLVVTPRVEPGGAP